MIEKETKHTTGTSHYIADKENSIVYYVTLFPNIDTVSVSATIGKIRPLLFDRLEPDILFNVHLHNIIIEIEYGPTEKERVYT